MGLFYFISTKTTYQSLMSQLLILYYLQDAFFLSFSPLFKFVCISHNFVWYYILQLGVWMKRSKFQSAAVLYTIGMKLWTKKEYIWFYFIGFLIRRLHKNTLIKRLLAHLLFNLYNLLHFASKIFWHFAPNLCFMLHNYYKTFFFY